MFKPDRVLFEKNALNTELGRRILDTFKDDKKVDIISLTSNRIKEHLPGDDIHDKYRSGKKTLVVGEHKTLKFQSCKPSAHYQLPLVSGCMGQCEYCYLNTRLGEKPYLKIHTNIDEILDRALEYIKERKPDITIFEGSATSDPVPVEPYTHFLKRVITFFANQELGRFRFVTKFNDVDTLLDIEHNNHTEVRFSINTNFVIDNFEHRTASRDKRIEAATKMMASGYPVGFLIAPVFLYDNWKTDYTDLLDKLKSSLPNEIKHPITFEIITHRYTTAAKNVINTIFPDNKLPMTDEERTYKYGQFGYGKYVYSKELLAEVKEFFTKQINDKFENAKILYVI